MFQYYSVHLLAVIKQKVFLIMVAGDGVLYTMIVNILSKWK